MGMRMRMKGGTASSKWSRRCDDSQSSGRSLVSPPGRIVLCESEDGVSGLRRLLFVLFSCVDYLCGSEGQVENVLYRNRILS